MRYRALEVGEWPLWRELRLEALAESPDAFRPTLEEERDQPDAWWIDIIDSTVEHPRGGLWIAEDDSHPVGMLFARTDPDDSNVEIGAMWVRASARGRGVGSGLLSVALDWAISRGVRNAELWVTMTNDAAVALYERSGFRQTTETQALRPWSQVTVMKMQAPISPQP